MDRRHGQLHAEFDQHVTMVFFASLGLAWWCPTWQTGQRHSAAELDRGVTTEDPTPAFVSHQISTLRSEERKMWRKFSLAKSEIEGEILKI